MALLSTGRFTPALRRLTHYSHDRCASCNRALGPQEVAFAGYAAADHDAERYVGSCCYGELVELASHIYWWWTSFKRPEKQTPLYRYIDLSKLIAMLSSSTFYFARADKLGDPFEGARGYASRQDEWRTHCINYFSEAIRNPPLGAPPSPDVIAEQAKRLYDSSTQAGEAEKLANFVSCWHAGADESEALWRLYAPTGSSGVALRTSFGRVDASFDQNYDIRAGHVQYVNFAKAFAGTYDRLFWKRSSLSHECEVRFVNGYLPGYAPDQTGIGIPTNLSMAIEAVIPSPFAPEWFSAVLENTIKQFGYNIPVQPSTLLAEPFF